MLVSERPEATLESLDVNFSENKIVSLLLTVHYAAKSLQVAEFLYSS